MTAVLFDMDGVLVDSETYWERTERTEILPTVVPDADVALEEITGRPYREIYTYLDEHYEVAVSRERFLELFETTAEEIYSEQVSLLAGLDTLRAALDERSVPVALVTSSPYEWVDIVRDRFDLSFDAVVSAADVPAGKPEPDIYEAAAGALDRDPDACVAVEDSTHGARAATAAGCHCIGYVGVHDSLDRTVVDEVAATPDELRERVLVAVD